MYGTGHVCVCYRENIRLLSIRQEIHLLFLLVFFVYIDAIQIIILMRVYVLPFMIDY